MLLFAMIAAFTASWIVTGAMFFSQKENLSFILFRLSLVLISAALGLIAFGSRYSMLLDWEKSVAGTAVCGPSALMLFCISIFLTKDKS